MLHHLACPSWHPLLSYLPSLPTILSLCQTFSVLATLANYSVGTANTLLPSLLVSYILRDWALRHSHHRRSIISDVNLCRLSYILTIQRFFFFILSDLTVELSINIVKFLGPSERIPY
jgi:hypothetical protein